jgi:hypothetical protein
LWYTNNQLFLAHISYILSLSLSLSVFFVWDKLLLCCPGRTLTLGLKGYSYFSLPKSWNYKAWKHT